MRIEATGTGKTIEDAIAAACAKLNVDRDSVSIEVVTTPSKKVLGLLGGTEAEVLAYYENSEPEPVAKKAVTEDSVPAVEEKKPTKKAVKEKVHKDKKAVMEAAVTEDKPEEMPEENPKKGTKAQEAEDFLKKIIPYISASPVTIDTVITEENIKINIDGEDINSIIGRRGETLDALQYLTGIVSSKSSDRHMRVYIDTGNYRARREETLMRIAKKYAERVAKSGRSLTLEPMSPNERRIIHMVVQDMDGVESFSKGEGSQRRVVIAPKR